MTEHEKKMQKLDNEMYETIIKGYREVAMTALKAIQVLLNSTVKAIKDMDEVAKKK